MRLTYRPHVARSVIAC